MMAHSPFLPIPNQHKDDELSLYIKKHTPYLSKIYPYKKHGSLSELMKVVGYNYKLGIHLNANPDIFFCKEKYTGLVKTWISIHRNSDVEETWKFKML